MESYINCICEGPSKCFCGPLGEQVQFCALFGPQNEISQKAHCAAHSTAKGASS